MKKKRIKEYNDDGIVRDIFLKGADFTKKKI